MALLTSLVTNTFFGLSPFEYEFVKGFECFLESFACHSAYRLDVVRLSDFVDRQHLFQDVL